MPRRSLASHSSHHHQSPLSTNPLCLICLVGLSPSFTHDLRYSVYYYFPTIIPHPLARSIVVPPSIHLFRKCLPFGSIVLLILYVLTCVFVTYPISLTHLPPSLTFSAICDLCYVSLVIHVVET